MHRVLIPVGFLCSLVIAACSFSSLMAEDAETTAQLPQQTFFIPKSNNGGIDECLADHSDCGRAAAASICESKGYHKVVAFGEASPEDLTGSIEKATSSAGIESGQPQDLPFLITCSK